MTRWWDRFVARLCAREIAIASARAFGAGWQAGWQAGIVSRDSEVAFYRDGWHAELGRKDAQAKRGE